MDAKGALGIARRMRDPALQLALDALLRLDGNEICSAKREPRSQDERYNAG
jgi:hypothetical protein